MWVRYSNLFRLTGLVVLVLAIGWFETARPGGRSFSSLTGGIVTFDTVVRIGILTMVVVGLNLVMGYTGQASLGQAAFYALGAYGSAIFTTRASVLGFPAAIAGSWWWPWLLIVAAMLFTGAFAYLVGRPILRLKGHYLAMATLGLGVTVYIIFRENLGLSLNNLNLTGGYDGLHSIPRLAIGSFELWPVERYYYLVWGLAILVLALSLNIVNSRIGRALRAIHGSEIAAEAMGVDTAGLKVTALVVSAMFASLAGSLYAHYQAAVSPTPFNFAGSLELVVMAAVGGMATIWGAPIGVTLILVIQEFLRARLHLWIEGASGEIEVIVFGLILVLLMIFMPDGVSQGSGRLIRRLRGWSVEPQEDEEIEEVEPAAKTVAKPGTSL